MAMLRIKQIREMSENERSSKLSEMRLDLMKEMGGIRMGKPVKNTGRIGELKRSISRILTVKNEIRNQIGEKKK
jgi:large subunit ribosomal protein L29